MKHLFTSRLLIFIFTSATILMTSCGDKGTPPDPIEDEDKDPTENPTSCQIIKDSGVFYLSYIYTGDKIDYMLYGETDTFDIAYANNKIDSISGPWNSGGKITYTSAGEIEKLTYYKSGTKDDSYLFSYTGGALERVEKMDRSGTLQEIYIMGYDSTGAFTGFEVQVRTGRPDMPYEMAYAHSISESDGKVNPYQGHIPFLYREFDLFRFLMPDNITKLHSVDAFGGFLQIDVEYTYNSLDYPLTMKVDDGGNPKTHHFGYHCQ